MNPFPPRSIVEKLKRGCVIPAHPLALTSERKLDEKHQRALSRYYLAAGAGGLAVGVHTTQFQIRESQVGLLKPVWELAADVMRQHDESNPDEPVIRIAGICGKTTQATAEAQLAKDLGYHIGLLGLSAFKDASTDGLIEHAETIAEIIPLMGFYLQPSVGGRILDVEFWRRFCRIENVAAIKIAPFNRYQTIDVLRAIAETGREDDVALYTGNDDNILIDLLTQYEFIVDGEPVRFRIVGGLLGHWAVWTRRAVEQLETVHDVLNSDQTVPSDLLTLATQITDSNAAFFDPRHQFAGCIAGLHEVLRRQRLMEGIWCLNPNETLSPGQMDEIDRVYNAYPHLNDDDFIARHLDEWLQ